MIVKCTNCDLNMEGKEFPGYVEGIDIDGEKCPNCGSDNSLYKFIPMTEEQEKELNNFMESLDLADCEEYEQLKKDDGCGSIHIETYERVNEIISNSKDKLTVYTIVEVDCDEMYICKGERFVNRIGYILSKNDIDIPEEGLRYL